MNTKIKQDTYFNLFISFLHLGKRLAGRKNSLAAR